MMFFAAAAYFLGIACACIALWFWESPIKKPKETPTLEPGWDEPPHFTDVLNWVATNRPPAGIRQRILDRIRTMDNAQAAFCCGRHGIVPSNTLTLRGDLENWFVSRAALWPEEHIEALARELGLEVEA